jgi:hypothetical protein
LKGRTKAQNVIGAAAVLVKIMGHAAQASVLYECERNTGVKKA